MVGEKHPLGSTTTRSIDQPVNAVCYDRLENRREYLDVENKYDEIVSALPRVNRNAPGKLNRFLES